MKHNPFKAIEAQARRAGEIAAKTAADQGAGPQNASAGQLAGDVDSNGEWQPYGQFGRTTFGDGFRLRT